MAAIDSTSDIDTYTLTGKVKKQYFLLQISMADVNIEDDILLSCHENMTEIRLTNVQDRKTRLTHCIIRPSDLCVESIAGDKCKW